MNTRKAVVFSVLAIAAVALAGCSTIEGAGKDISAAGQGISNAADETGKAIVGEK